MLNTFQDGVPSVVPMLIMLTVCTMYAVGLSPVIPFVNVVVEPLIWKETAPVI